jgi:hypothetical protein
MTQFANAIQTATKSYADAVAHEMLLENERHAVKLAAITRIMGSGDNPLTGKPHSFSSAEAVVHADSDYMTHLEKMREAVHQRILAMGAFEAAKAAAKLQEVLA